MEAAISAHFGTPVHLVLIIDDDGGPPPRTVTSPAPESPHGPAGGIDGIDDVDPSDLVAAEDDAASEAEARLLQAFPGASEVGA